MDFVLFPSAAIVLLGMLATIRPRDRHTHAFLVALVSIPLLAGATFLFSRHFSAISPMRYDQFFYLVDRRLFGCPAFALGRILAAHPLLHQIALIDYSLFVDVALFAVLVTFIGRGVRAGYAAWLAVLLNACALPVFYGLLPASGPLFAFVGFPFVAPAIAAPHVISIAAPPNCFPSGHLALALLSLYFLWFVRWLRPIAIAHVALTILATLGLGEHYAIDLIAAVPYTFGLVMASAHLPPFRACRLRPTVESTIGAPQAAQ